MSCVFRSALRRTISGVRVDDNGKRWEVNIAKAVVRAFFPPAVRAVSAIKKIHRLSRVQSPLRRRVTRA